MSVCIECQEWLLATEPVPGCEDCEIIALGWEGER